MKKIEIENMEKAMNKNQDKKKVPKYLILVTLGVFKVNLYSSVFIPAKGAIKVLKKAETNVRELRKRPGEEKAFEFI